MLCQVQISVSQAFLGYVVGRELFGKYRFVCQIQGYVVGRELYGKFRFVMYTTIDVVGIDLCVNVDLYIQNDVIGRELCDSIVW